MEELEVIVQRMIDAGEPEENIAKVIKAYDTKKPTDPVKETAIVGSENQAVNGDSVLDPGLLDLQKINNIRKAFGGQENPEEIVAKENAHFDSISGYLEKLSKIETKPIKEESPILAEAADISLRAIGAFGYNLPKNLEIAWESTKAGGIDWLSNVAGKDATDFLLSSSEEIKNKGKIIKNDDGDFVYEKTNELIGKATEDFLINEFDKVNKLSSELEDVGGVVSGIKNRSVNEAIGGVFNAVSGVIGTAGPALVTRGASLFPQVVAPMYTEYNIAKANSLYGDKENPMQELVSKDETETAIPLALGGVALGLEYVGFKGISKQIAGKAGKLGPFASLLLTQNKEGTTELLQSGVEKFSTEIASGKNKTDAMISALDYMASEDGLESYIGGFIGSGVFSAPSTIKRALISDQDVLNSIRTDIDKIAQLQLAKQNTKSSEFKNVIDGKITEIEDQLRNTINNTYITEKFLSKENKTELLGLLEEKNEIDRSLYSLQLDYKNKVITGQQFGAAKGVLANKKKNITNKIAGIKNSVDKDLIKLDIERSKQTIKNLNLDARIETPVLLKTNKEVEEYMLSMGYAPQEAKNLSTQSYGFFAPKKFGDKKHFIVVNEEAALAKGVTTTGRHESLHAFLLSAVSKNNKLALNIGENLIKEIEKILGQEKYKNSKFYKRWQGYKAQTDNADALIAKIDSAISTNSQRLKNKEITQEEYDNEVNKLYSVRETAISRKADRYEEVMTLLSEELSEKNIEADSGIFTTLNDFFRRQLQNLGIKDIKLETGKDAFNFVKDFNKSFDKGKFTKAQKKFANLGGIAVKESKIKQSSSREIQEELNKLEDLIMDGSIDYDTYEQRLNVLEKKLEDTEKKEAEEKAKPKPKKQKESDVALKDASAKSKKILDDIGNDPKGFNKNSPKIYEVLEGIIKSKSRTFRTASGNVVNLTNLPGFEMENMVAETISYMVPMINKFDPKKNDSLYGYLNSQLANKMRQALKSGKVTEERFTDDVTEVKGLAEDEVTVTKAEKPKYTKIMDADVFSTDVINTISDKMVSTVRVLKNKLNAVVGKNQNTTPLIKEILQDISTQADIDIKKAMGGKEDGKLRKFLLKNKQAIIENSTTTFLMGKDQGDKVLGGLPIAIQKQVDGKFLPYPEWVGKKIDRETTAERGATAGNQIVRRVPASKISDADYLSFFLEPTGNPIRGRKEALAKELAGETGLELFVEAIEAADGPIFEAFENNRDVIGEVLGDYYVGEVVKQVERGTIKFSMAAKRFDVLSREAISSMLQPTKTARDKALKDFESKYKGLEYDEIKELIIDPLLERLEDIANELDRRNSGFAREEAVIDAIKKAEKSIPGLKLITRKGAKSDNRVDIILIYKGNKIGIELKLDKRARLGSFQISNYLNNPSLTLNTQFNNKILEAIKGNNNIEKLKEFVVKNGGKIEKGKLLVTEGILSKIGGVNGLRSKAQTFLTLPIDLIYERYLQKETPTNYMDFGDLGLFYLSDNPLNLPIPQLQGDIKLRIHFKRNKARKDGLITLSLVADPSLTTASANKLTENSNYTLLSEKSIKNVFKDAEVLTNEASSDVVKLSAAGQELNPSKKTKGISVWDFDDTLATTKSNVLYTMPDGSKGKLNAEEFAQKGDDLLEQGAEFDFSEFSKVMNGAKGPMFDKAIARNKKFGNDNVYILTARPANSATAIHEFLKGLGLDIKLENIIGLGNSTAQAKADWINSKVAEGYNDFYFADDAYKNVKAVQDILDIADVKSKVQQAYIKFSQAADPKMLNKEFNLMLERKKGLKAGAKISRARAEQLGKNKGRYRYFLPPNAEDFNGLLYNFLGKGDIGDKDFQFFKEYLIDPFNIAENAISSFRQRLAENLRILKKELGNIDKDISKETIKKIEAIGFTPDQAVRVFIWNRKGEDIPELKADEKAKILGIVRRDPKLMAYARELMKITDQFGGYPPPSDTWFAGNSKSDMYKFANENVRKKYLENWQANADAIFNSDNMNKLQALYGKDFVINLKQVLGRMKSGSNRPIGMNDAGSKMLDYINGSVGVIMFLNVRSAVLQTISSVNFLNWHDNNLFSAGKTLANPKNFAKSFIEIMNSDFLKQRRSGLEINVNEAEIATAAEQSKNKAKALFNSIIKAGYKPTQFADSFAIAIGGTPFLINRTKTYEKQGLSAAEAKEKAFADFREIAEENQQSSRTDKTSNIQASNLGRLVFAFNNTPFQYTRIMKKAVLDIANRRGDLKTNISKILYYGAIQNIIFYTLQQALMASLFGAGDDEDEVKKQSEKIARLGNSMLDSILRGSGLPGAVISTAKNVIIEYMAQEEKGSFRADHGKTLVQALNFSPPIGSKASKTYTGIKGAKYEKTTMDMLKNKSKIVSAVTNFPVDRLVTKADNLIVATTEPIETWKRAALFLGWDQWSLGIYDDLKEAKDSEKPKADRSEIMKEVWRKRKEQDKKERDSIRGLRKEMSAEDLLKSLVKEKTKK